MEYLHFDPSQCDFPKANVPALPPLCRQSLGKPLSGRFDIIRPVDQARQFVRARYALFEAFRLCGVAPGERVLVPAYHCRTMLDPAIRLGAQVTLYSLKEDLSPNIEELERLLINGSQRFTALLVTHFFGFRQPLEPLASLCNHHGITLIEDCAHALFSDSEAHREPSNKTGAKYVMTGYGQVGSFCIASPAKFFPCEDGGLLWSNDESFQRPIKSRTPTLANQTKGWLFAMRSVILNGNAAFAQQLETSVEDPQTTNLSEGDHRSEHSTVPSRAYDPSLEGVGCLASSSWVMRHTDVHRLAEKRRINYATWAQRVSNLPFCKPLQQDIPDDCVPYMFPLVLEQPGLHFYPLKRLGVPIWRWDDMAVSQCKVANLYRLGLLHLPCHQELTEAQMDRMLTALASVLTPSKGRTR